MPDTSTDPRRHNARSVRSPRGPQLSAKSWLTEAPLRVLMRDLDHEVAEKPEDLVVYGDIVRAARHSECFAPIVSAHSALGAPAPLLVQYAPPLGLLLPHTPPY